MDSGFEVSNWTRFLEFLICVVEHFQVASDMVMNELMSVRSNSKIIVSSYVNGGGSPTTEKLGNLIINLQSTGADIIKLVIDVAYITDVAPVFQMLTHCQVYSFLCFDGYC